MAAMSKEETPEEEAQRKKDADATVKMIGPLVVRRARSDCPLAEHASRFRLFWRRWLPVHPARLARR